MSQIEREQSLADIVWRYRAPNGSASAVGQRRMADDLFREAIQCQLGKPRKDAEEGQSPSDDTLEKALNQFAARLGELVGTSKAHDAMGEIGREGTQRGRPPTIRGIWTKLGLSREADRFGKDADLVFHITLHRLIEAALGGISDQEILDAQRDETQEGAPEPIALETSSGRPNVAVEVLTGGDLDAAVAAHSALDSDDTNEPAFEEFALSSQQHVYQSIWEALVVELDLRRNPDSALANREAKRMRDSSRPYVARLISEQIRSSFEENCGVKPGEGIQFAGTLAGLAMQSFRTPWFKFAREGRGGTNKVLPTRDLLRRVATLSMQTLTIHRHAPLIEEPIDWGPQGTRQGGFHVLPLPFYKFRWKNKPIREFIETTDNAGYFAEVFTAVNALQRTSWRVNARVWDIVRSLYEMAGVPVPEDADETLFASSAWNLGDRAQVRSSSKKPGAATTLRELRDDARGAAAQRRQTAIVEMDSGSLAEWRDWIKRAFYVSKGGRLSGPGARLGTRVALSTLLDGLGRARLYFAYQADTRGRLYPVTGSFTPQGDDLNRALLEFAEAKPLGASGAWYLAIHGSQQVSAARIMGDLNVRERSQPTQEERVRWIENNTDQICASARDALKEVWWRDVSKNPFMFLAFCYAWSDYKGAKYKEKFGCALPVYVDGTCNGLQHIAAITRNRELALSTSVLPGLVPRDIYAEVASEVRSRMLSVPNAPDNARRLARRRGRGATHSADVTNADRGIAIAFLTKFPDCVDRAMAKAVVMIIPYGAGFNKYQEAIGDSLITQVLAQWPRGEPEPPPTPMQKWLQTISDLDRWLPKTRGGFSKPAAEKRAAIAGWIRAVCAYHLAEHFSEALGAMFPVIGGFKRRLSAAIEPVVKRKLPVMWVSPSGFPVLQDAFQLSENAFDVKILENRLRYSLRELGDAISVQGQRTGILPNLIHSLDAAHLVKTLCLAQGRGISSVATIHDAFGTHASDMGVLGECIRDAFCEVYPRDVDYLQEFSEWCLQLANATCMASANKPQETIGKARQSLLSLAQRWMTSEGGSVPSTPAKSEIGPEGGDWIDQVRESRYFFT